MSQYISALIGCIFSNYNKLKEEYGEQLQHKIKIQAEVNLFNYKLDSEEINKLVNIGYMHTSYYLSAFIIKSKNIAKKPILRLRFKRPLPSDLSTPTKSKLIESV